MMIASAPSPLWCAGFLVALPKRLLKSACEGVVAGVVAVRVPGAPGAGVVAAGGVPPEGTYVVVGVVAAGAVALPALPAGAVEVVPVDPVEPDFAPALAAAPATDIAWTGAARESTRAVV